MNDSKKKYGYRFAAHHTAKAGTRGVWGRYFASVETDGFLDRQAEHFGSFEQTSEDLETHCLPAIIELQDWDRFVHYALIAANLRGLAEALAEADVLAALTRHGRLDLAESLVDRLSDRVQRARARAAIAGAIGADPSAFDRLADGLVQDLDTASAPTGREAADAWCEALEAAARLGRELRADWTEWIRRLDAWPDLAGRAWKAVAEGLLASADLEDPELWQAIGAVSDADGLLESLSRRLVAARPDERWHHLERIRRLEPIGEWTARSTCAATAARLEAGEAAALWWRATDAWEPLPWSLELVEAGRRLWPKLAPEDFKRIVDGAGNPTVKAALRLTRLEQLSHESTPAQLAGDFAAALEEIDRIPFPPQKLHQSLRYLAVRPRGAGLERQLVAAGEYLARRRYFMPAGDLCRFLDLVAEVFPRRLRLEVQNVLWAPESRAETLRTLALEARTTRLLEELLERIDPYASTVAANEAEGFELRLEVLVTVTRRLCNLRQDLSALDQAAERLLPEEEDSLRAVIAEEMAAIGRTDLARTACHPIRQGRLRRRTRLATAARAELEELLAPGALYQAVADVDAVEDEHRALSALLEAPTDPGELARGRLAGIRGKGREIQALVDLAWHTLAFQEQTLERRRQDRPAALAPLKGTLGVVESDAWLVALTPELAALGARLGTSQALAELNEASEKIVAQESVPWPLREHALEAILARLECFFSERAGELSGTGCRAAAAFVDRLVDLPRALEGTPGAAELQQHWHRVLPRIVAALERLPSRVEAHLRHPLRMRLGLNPPVPEGRSAAAGRSLERFRDRWGDLRPAQEQILELCFASMDERLRRADDVEAQADPDPDVVHTLAYLLAARDPERVAALVERLPSGDDRDRLILRWIRYGWAPKQDIRMFDLLGPERVHLGKAWHRLHGGSMDDADWVAEIRGLISRDEFDPSDPRNTELRRGLWRLDGQHLPALAKATLGALASGGKGGGERGLRLFLNALLAPRFGHQGTEPKQQRGEIIATAADRARSLAGETQTEYGGESSPGAAVRRSSRGLRRWPRAWSNRIGRLLTRDLGWNDPGSLALLVGIALFPPLMSLDAAVLGTEPLTPWVLTPPVAAGVVAGIWLLDTWALGTALSLQTTQELGLRPAVRSLRTLWVGLPLIGLFVLPIWRRLLERRDRWLFRSRGLSGRLDLAETATVGRRRPPALERLTGGVQWTGRTWGFVGLYLVNFAVVFMAAYALAERASVDSRWRVPAAIVCGLLHAVAGAAVAYYALHTIRAEKISDWRAAVLASMPLFWLVPVPGLPIMGMMLLVVSPTPPKSLSTEAFAAVGVPGLERAWFRGD